MRSSLWANFRKLAIVNAGRRCQCCGANTVVLEVHHLHYRTLGNEAFSDVVVCCKPCHIKQDKLREEREQNDAYHRNVDRFARRKFGDDWELTVSSLDTVYSAYDDFESRT
jgi:5-methylcytosine-specific restriction endonuclease McrA